MNDRIVYLGPLNNKKQDELMDKAIYYLKENKGEEFYYLLPNGELLKRQRQNFINKVENVFDINLFTFDNIVNKILENENMEIIENPIKNIIINRILKELVSNNKLRYYKGISNNKGFIHSINDIIGEIKRSLIYPDDYLSKCPDQLKYKEIGIIYKEYEKTLKEFNLEDREGAYFKSIEILRENDFLKDLKFIIIDEFYDFRPIELAILKELINTDLDIYINIPFDTEDRPFIVDKTLDSLKELGFTIEYIEKKDKRLFEDIGNKIFSNNIDLYNSTKDIEIINGPTEYLELRRIFEEIKKLHSRGIDLKDIGLVITNNEYLPLLYDLAEEEGIPISIDKSIKLKQMKISKEILGLLENRINNGSKFNLINRVKFTYFNISEKDKKDIYELLLRRLNFKSIEDLNSILEKRKSINIPTENIEDLQEIIEIIEEEIEDIPDKDSISNYNKYIISKIEEFNIVEKVLNIYKDNKDERLFLKNILGINKIKDILKGIESLPLFSVEISLEEYYLILEEHLENESIIEKEGNTKGIHILNPVNSRGIYKEVLFITGLSQSVYPILNESNYFFNDESFKYLRNTGIDIKSYKERLSNEEVKFASMISACKNKLYLSYYRGVDDVGLPSMFLDDFLELFKDVENIINSSIDLKYLIKKNIEDVTNSKDLNKYLLHNFYKDNLDGKIVYENIDSETISLINEKLQGEVYRNKEYFNEYRGLLQGETIEKDVNENINKLFSISYLESYNICPYAFMMSNLFGIETMERDWEDYSPMDIGSIYHEVLRHYYQHYVKDIEEYVLGKKEFNVDDTIEYLENIVYEYALEYEFNIEIKRELLIVENIITNLKGFIEEDLKRLYKNKLIPYEFEVDFGNSLEFYIENEDVKIPIIGRIDRIDKFLDKDKYVIIDYKSSNYGVRSIDDMKVGLSLQLPVYIMSQEDKDILLGAYGIIRNGQLEIKLGLVEETGMITKRNKGALDREEWNELMDLTKENVFNTVDNIKKGDFSVNPLECSKYCPYKYICRYENALEDRE